MKMKFKKMPFIACYKEDGSLSGKIKYNGIDKYVFETEGRQSFSKSDLNLILNEFEKIK